MGGGGIIRLIWHRSVLLMSVNRTDEILKIIFENIRKNFDDNGVTELTISFETLLAEDYTYIEKMLRKMRLFELLNIDYSKNRILYDGDAIFFSLEGNRDCKRGDVLISFWTPFSRYIDCIPKGGRRNGAYCKTYFTISRIIEEKHNRETFKAECHEFEYLAKSYWSRGNLLYLPDRVRDGKYNMNSDRFFSTGIQIEDKVDQTLYHCFENGVLADYFRDNEELIKWIYSEHLECMFIDGFFNYSLNDIAKGEIIYPTNIKIRQANIQNMITDKKCDSYMFSNCKKQEIEEYIRNANKIIAYRNTAFGNI